MSENSSQQELYKDKCLYTVLNILLSKVQRLEKKVAILEIDNKGILKKKEIYDLNKMNKYKFSENTTQDSYEKNSYIYGVLTSLREKINAPAKRKKVSE